MNDVPQTPPSPSLPLLERDGFLADLGAALGTGRIALVAGEAGIGKTALVQAFAARVPSGTRVWWGGCDPLSTPLPLGPLHDIAQSQPESTLAALLARGETRDALFTAFLDHLRQPGAVAILEDVHWADEATLDLLRFVGRRIQRTRGLLIVTYRSDEIAPSHPLRLALGEVPRAATIRIQLPPLSEAAVATLARHAGRSAAGLHAAGGGNPFFITEILGNAEGNVPITVRDAVLARVARLSPAARTVLDLASVVPGRIERWLLEAVAGTAPETLDECITAGTLLADRDSLSFRHELARLSLGEALPAARARDLHRRILRTLVERAPEALSRLAHHAAGAGDAAAVLRYAPSAAREAERLGGHREAAAHYAAALACASGLPPAERAELLERRAFECFLTGQIPEAIEARDAALDIWNRVGDSLRAGDTLRWLSRLHWVHGQRAAAERYAAEAVATLESLTPAGPALAMAYSNRAQLEMLAQHVSETVAWGTRAIALAEQLGHTETLIHALNNVGTARFDAGEDAGREMLERSLRVSLEHGLDEHAARAYSNLGSAAVQTRRYAVAERFLREGIEYCQDRDLDTAAFYMIGWRARFHLDRGAWSEAGEDAAYVLAHPRASPISRIQALVVLGLLRARRGDPDVAPVLDEAEALARPTEEIQRIGLVAEARAEAAWIRGDADGVAREAAWAEGGTPDHARWDCGALGDFLRRVGRPARPADRHPPPYRALAAGDWRGAAAAWTELGCPYERALALAAGDDPTAVREAAGLLRELGADATVAAITRDLRARGMRGVPRGPRPATRANPAGLTDRQYEVLTLLTLGLRNAEIAQRLKLSPRTADHHVSAVLAKLGVHTRAQAAAAARGLPLR